MDDLLTFTSCHEGDQANVDADGCIRRRHGRWFSNLNCERSKIPSRGVAADGDGCGVDLGHVNFRPRPDESHGLLHPGEFQHPIPKGECRARVLGALLTVATLVPWIAC